MLALTFAATVQIGVFGSFHPAQLEVWPSEGTTLVVETLGRTETLAAGRSIRISAPARVAGHNGAFVRFHVALPSAAYAGKRIEREYLGRLEIRSQAGHLAAIVEMDRETAVASIVEAEGTRGIPFEARKAQAVVSRSYLMGAFGKRHSGFDFCDGEHCQLLKNAPSQKSEATLAASATRGQVLTFHGSVLAALYSANCGGHTESNENVWPDMAALPSLRGHRDAGKSVGDPYAGGITPANIAAFIAAPPAAYCGQSHLGSGDRYRWTVTRTGAELENLLAKYRLGTVKGIEVLERGVSGRARAVRVTGAARAETIRGELRIRQAFGNLRSSLFVVEMKAGSALFHGAGFGHGVGMCQTGAIGMAEAGKKYQEILRHYYPGTVLRKLW